MSNLIFWIKNRINSFIYATFLFCALEFEVHFAQLNRYDKFLPISAALGVIVVIELLSSVKYLRNRYNDEEITHVIFQMIGSNIMHQIVIPVFLYIGTVGFIFFYCFEPVVHILILLIVIVYWVMFLNVRSIYERNLHLSHLSHGIYNFAKIITFFLLTNLIMFSYHYFEFSPIFIGLVIASSSLVFLLLLLSRHQQFTIVSFVYSVLASIVIGTIGYFVGQLTYTNYFSLSMYVTIIYYVILSIFHHKAEGTLTMSILLEYFGISLLSMIILAS